MNILNTTSILSIVLLTFPLVYNLSSPKKTQTSHCTVKM